ncbi:MAG: rhodanese-like domain-containing protein [Reyranellaceae bacterium]
MDDRSIDPNALKQLIRQGGDFAIVDARDEDTFSTRHLLLASCLPLSRLEVMAPRLLPRRGLPIIVCDDGDGLAERAGRRLRAAGYTDVRVLAGGIAAWSAGHRLYSGVHVPSKGFAEVVEHVCGTPHLSAQELEAMIRSGADIAVFDSRSYEEYHVNSIPTAVSVPGAELVYRFDDLVPSKDTLVVVNCGGRTRSIIGAQALINAGVPNRVCSLANGTMAWHLAGYEVVKGATRRAPSPSTAGLAAARQRAEAVASRVGVRHIDKAELARFRAEAAVRTLHVLDVRSPEEFAAGHLPGTVSVAGGQLIQETDNWIASWGARIVLVDDTAVRALMTASWLRQMGYREVCVLDEAFQGEALAHGPGADADLGVPLDGPEPSALTPAQLAARLAPGEVEVVDVGLSKAYGRGHVPGARHAVRSRLARLLDRLAGDRLLVLTSEDGILARYAAAEAAALGRSAAWLAGGSAAWTRDGHPLEAGFERVLDEPDDVWYAPRDRRTDRERHMREYLAWEIDLVNQLQSDEDARFEIAR